MKDQELYNSVPSHNTDRRLAQQVGVVADGIEGEVLDLVRHQRRGAVEEGQQLRLVVVARHLLPLVTLVEDVLHLREPSVTANVPPSVNKITTTSKWIRFRFCPGSFMNPVGIVIVVAINVSSPATQPATSPTLPLVPSSMLGAGANISSQLEKATTQLLSISH